MVMVRVHLAISRWKFDCSARGERAYVILAAPAAPEFFVLRLIAPAVYHLPCLKRSLSPGSVRVQERRTIDELVDGYG